MIRISTWNLCLGLKNKKQYIYDTLAENRIEICAVQEVEIKKDYPEHLLSSRNYKIEIEKCTEKARCAILIKDNINYTRRNDLEEVDSSVVIIDVNMKTDYRIINVYRSFNPPNNVTQKQAFRNQLAVIDRALKDPFSGHVIIMGDFNLDGSKSNATDYRLRDYFDDLQSTFDQHNLIQVINFSTWQRIINNVLKESTLDHVYVKNPLIINTVYAIKPLIGDHSLIIAEINGILDPPKVLKKRSWKNYSKDELLRRLTNVNFDTCSDNPQSIWNHFEESLTPIIDELAPLVDFTNNTKVEANPPVKIKSKINLRKKLLIRLKRSPTPELKLRVKNLNIEIRSFYLNQKKSAVQRSIIPGNSKSLWNAVKVAKNTNVSKLPPIMSLNGQTIPENELPDAFAEYFKNKIEKIMTETKVDENVYNGKRKLNCLDENFMTRNEVLAAVKTLSIKNCEGHDRIPQRFLVDGIDILIGPLSHLFSKIYDTKNIPQQWLISKINPLHKKGNQKEIENYRPIANLCSASKIFEKLILIKIQKLEALNKINLTGKPQHGFKRKHSTTTAGLTIQSLIASALNDDNFVIMASLDLSAAFDVVNIELLVKRLKIIGLPSDIVELITNWLSDRSFYVSIDGNNSFVHLSKAGTVQGSILGPILYAIFVSPLFDLAKMTLFADDNYVLEWNKSVNQLIIDMQRKIELITKWLRQSGLKVNDSKTEACLFHRKDHPPIRLQINAQVIITKPSMNVLGVVFDSKLQWHAQVQNAITKSKKALHAIILIKKYFRKDQLLNIITACYYSILYYNSEIWHLPHLSPILKQKLMSASAAPLKLTTSNYHRMISYESLHYLNKRATPQQITTYKHALLLHKTYNDDDMGLNWTNLFFNQQFSSRELNVHFTNNAKYKIGKNIITNRFEILNGKVPLVWLNETFESFKIKCKVLLLTQE